MEGISNEVCSLAGHWGLGKLIAFYDDNHISIDGDTEIAFTESVDKRFEGLGWHVIWVKNGNTGYDEIRAAIKEAKAVTDKPTLIKVRYLLIFRFLSYVRLRSLVENVNDSCLTYGYKGYTQYIKLPLLWVLGEVIVRHMAMY